jgi:hypothetical protein
VWTGRIDISFTNLEAAPLGTIYLRLWSNGVYGCGAGAIQIWDLTGGNMGAPALDCTEIPVTLAKTLAQGERATLSMQLRITLPWLKDRFGYSGGLALVGTALPTLEVHDDQGWHHDPFEDLGESFYSITGRYRVTLEGPPDLDTPTTGTLVGGPVPLPGGLVARTYAADGVRDFAWAAGRLEQVSGGTAPRVVVSYRAGAVTKTQAERMLAAARTSVSKFSQSFGPYPYPELDVVLAAFSDFGMEYPTIVFSEVDKWTVAHEIAHQWWYGLVGNDQYAAPWLDESLATWSGDLPWGAWVGCAPYDFPGSARLTGDMRYWGDHPAQYTDVVYDAGGCMLANLAQKFGTTRFLGILRGYATGHWLGVARTGDFTAAIEAAAVLHGVPFNPDVYWSTWRVDTP